MASVTVLPNSVIETLDVFGACSPKTLLLSRKLKTTWDLIPKLIFSGSVPVFANTSIKSSLARQHPHEERGQAGELLLPLGA